MPGDYLKEIASLFTQKRQRGVMIAPRDWLLVEKWQQTGIPLKLVLRGIEKTFQQIGTDEQGYQRVNFLSCCESQIIKLWQDYKEQLVGQPEKDTTPAAEWKDVVEQLGWLQYSLGIALSRQHPEKKFASAWRQAQQALLKLKKEVSSQKWAEIYMVEQQLKKINKQLLVGLRAAVTTSELQEIEKSARQQLAVYQEKMVAEVYQQTLTNLVNKELYLRYQLPELTLHPL